MKKILRIMLLVMILVIVMSLTSMAAEPKLVNSGTLSSNPDAKWELYDNGLLKLEGSGSIEEISNISYGMDEMYWLGYDDYDYENHYKQNYADLYADAERHKWSVNIRNAKEIIIGDGFTKLAKGAFVLFENLEKVTLGNGITEIPAGSFKYCNNLTTINLSNVNKIGEKTFFNCWKLENYKIKEGADVSPFAFLGTRNGFVSSGLLREEGDGKYTDVGYTLDSNGTLHFYGTGEMPDYASALYYYEEQRSPFIWNEEIKNVIIDEGITSIGSNIFYGCTNIETISIPDSVKSIGYHALWDCKRIQGIEKSSKIIYGERALPPVKYSDNCKGGSIYFDQIGAEIVDADKKLTSATIPAKINGTKVKSIGPSAFDKCHSLVSISIPSGVVSIGDYAFRHCCKLKSLKVPEGAEQGKKVLPLVKYSRNCKGGSIYFDKKTGKIDDADSTLTSVKIPEKIAGVKVKGIAGTLSVKQMDASDEVDYRDYADVDNAFGGCHKLTTITIPKGITSVSSCAFVNSGIKTIKVAKGNKKYTSVGGVLFTKDKSTLVCFPPGKEMEQYTVPKKTKKVKFYCFCNTNVEYVNIPADTKLSNYCVSENGWNHGITDWPRFRSVKNREFVNSVVKGIIYPSNVKISYTSCSYTGEKKRPKVTVKLGRTKLTRGRSYTVSYKDNVKTGKATVTVTGKGKYVGQVKKTFIIHPAKVKNLKISARGSTYIKIRWSRATGSTGYKVMYKLYGSKKWKSTTTKSTYFKAGKLKKGRTYVFKVKAYKTIDGKKKFGSASNIVTVRTKW